MEEGAAAPPPVEEPAPEEPPAVVEEAPPAEPEEKVRRSCSVAFLLSCPGQQCCLVRCKCPAPCDLTLHVRQEMSLEEYEKVLAEKRANLNKKPAAKAFKADPKEFEGMKSYSREVRRSAGSAASSATRCHVSGLHQAGSKGDSSKGTQLTDTI